MLGLGSEKKADEEILYQGYKKEKEREKFRLVDTMEENTDFDESEIEEEEEGEEEKGVLKYGIIGAGILIVFLFFLIATNDTIKNTLFERFGYTQKKTETNQIDADRNMMGTSDIKASVRTDILTTSQEKKQMQGMQAEETAQTESTGLVTQVEETQMETQTVITEDGIDGQNGIDGQDGINGQSGIDGKNGIDGRDGISGTNGKAGMNGIDGKAGMNGVNGKEGMKGTDGKAGINGTNGKAGMNGVDGKAGMNGISGKDGIEGKAGIDGTSGKDGADGKTAYAAAVEAGYTGTEADYATFMASTPGKIVGFESDLGTLNSNLEVSIGTINESINKTIDNIGKTNARVEECFTSVSSGKSLLASTLTGFSFPTDASATFATIDTNVKNLADARYNNGFIDGQKNAMNNLQVTYVKHNHTGNATAGGGCYTNANIHNHTGGSSSGGGCYLTPQYREDPIYGMCANTYLSWDSHVDGTSGNGGFSRDYYRCGRCQWFGHNSGSGGDNKGWSHPHQSKTPTSYNKVLTGYGLSCGKSDGQNSGYSEACGYTEGQIISATITY